MTCLPRVDDAQSDQVVSRLLRPVPADSPRLKLVPKNDDPTPPIQGGGAVAPKEEAGKRQSIKSRIEQDYSVLVKLAAGVARRRGVDWRAVLNVAVLNMLRYPMRFDEAQPFLPWAATVIWNAGYRTEAPSSRLDCVRPRFGTSGSMEDEIPDPTAVRFLRMVEYRDLIAQIEEFVDELDERYRSCWKLWRSGVLNTRAATELGIPITTYSSRVARTHMMITDEFGHLYDSGVPTARRGPRGKPHAKKAA
jgi:DNA-directed RNA polymerase specialized sigma24 family protein